MCTVSLHTLRRTNRPLSAMFLFAADAGATTLDEVWVANRVHLVTEFFDWMCDPDRMPGGRAYLNEATYSRAVALLEQGGRIAPAPHKQEDHARPHRLAGVLGHPACAAGPLLGAWLGDER